MRRALASVVVLVVAAVLSGGVGDGAIGSGAVGAGAVGNGAVGSPQRGEEGDAITALAPLIDYDAALLELSDSDPVSSWPNSGSLGSDWDLTNAGASTTKPTYLAAGERIAAPAVEADGGDWLVTAAARSGMPTTWTALVVHDSDAYGSANYIFDSEDTDPRVAFGGQSAGYFVISGAVSFGSGSVATDAKTIAIITNTDGGTDRLYVNGQNLTPVITTRAPLSFTVFQREGLGSVWFGELYRLAFFPLSVSESEILAAAESVYGAFPE